MSNASVPLRAVEGAYWPSGRRAVCGFRVLRKVEALVFVLGGNPEVAHDETQDFHDDEREHHRVDGGEADANDLLPDLGPVADAILDAP